MKRNKHTKTAFLCANHALLVYRDCKGTVSMNSQQIGQPVMADCEYVAEGQCKTPPLTWRVAWSDVAPDVTGAKAA